MQYSALISLGFLTQNLFSRDFPHHLIYHNAYISNFSIFNPSPLNGTPSIPDSGISEYKTMG